MSVHIVVDTHIQSKHRLNISGGEVTFMEPIYFVQLINVLIVCFQYAYIHIHMHFINTSQFVGVNFKCDISELVFLLITIVFKFLVLW